MANSEVAVQYANALSQLAIETKQSEDISKDAKELLQLLDEDHDFVQFYSSRNIDADEKKEVIKKVFSKKINDYLFNLLMYLVDNADERLLENILNKFNDNLNEAIGVVEVKIFSPFELKKDDVDSILKKVEKKTLKKVHANVIIDPSLIGGIKVEYNDVVYNNSIRNKIDLIKNNIRKK